MTKLRLDGVSPYRKGWRRSWAAALLAALVAGPLQAADLTFPDSLLDKGDPAVLAAPVADFSVEMARLSLEPPKFHAVTNRGRFDGVAVETELQDLAAALKKNGLSAADAEMLCAAHRLELEKLAAWLATPEPRPAFPRLLPAIGLPDEFADYFDGAVAWADPAQTNKDMAREAWREVLNLPAPERHFKATWAAFMLGKSWPKEEPARAVNYFTRVQDLSARGFADPLGLAAESLGLEAQAELQQGHISQAIQLYLQQAAAGELSARDSLYLTVMAAINNEDGNSLAALAANPKVQPIITACFICGRQPKSSAPPDLAAARKWLVAVQAARITDVESAEKFALLAYQTGEWETAQAWIDHAPSAPMAQWLQAKLWLRIGQVEQAGALLVKVTGLFPLDPAAQSPPQWQDALTVPGETSFSSRIPASRRVRGELGLIRMARGEYAEALDALLRSGFWMDAAYVGERVLTVDELKNYVDRNWPASAPPTQNAADNPLPQTPANRGAGVPPAGSGGVPPPPDNLSAQIRYLLARRLARLQRPADARPYFPAPYQSEADALTQALASAADSSKSEADRARFYFAAAQMTETNGLELLATEIEPDWRSVERGENREAVAIAGRTNLGTNLLLRPSEDEMARVAASAPEPDAPDHYRFQAASIAWQAALLMPDNSDDTARVLCQAGTWIKKLDPKKADLFYKALVRRCRRTPIGAQADTMRWFPVLDAQGNPIPYEAPPVK